MSISLGVIFSIWCFEHRKSIVEFFPDPEGPYRKQVEGMAKDLILWTDGSIIFSKKAFSSL